VGLSFLPDPDVHIIGSSFDLFVKPVIDYSGLEHGDVFEGELEVYDGDNFIDGCSSFIIFSTSSDPPGFLNSGCGVTAFPNEGLYTFNYTLDINNTINESNEDNNALEILVQVGFSYECGNGIIEPGEVCDDDNLAGLNCQSFGLTSGNLSCNDCNLNISGCV